MAFAYKLTYFPLFCIGDGQITPQELAAVMKALGESLTEQDIMVMIQEADADGDGNIDFDGLFVDVLCDRF